MESTKVGPDMKIMPLGYANTEFRFNVVPTFLNKISNLPTFSGGAAIFAHISLSYFLSSVSASSEEIEYSVRPLHLLRLFFMCICLIQSYLANQPSLVRQPSFVKQLNLTSKLHFVRRYNLLRLSHLVI